MCSSNKMWAVEKHIHFVWDFVIFLRITGLLHCKFVVLNSHQIDPIKFAK